MQFFAIEDSYLDSGRILSKDISLVVDFSSLRQIYFFVCSDSLINDLNKLSCSAFFRKIPKLLGNLNGRSPIKLKTF